MIFFEKSSPPRQLTTYKRQAGARYPMDSDVREAVIRELLIDQHYLCAYCLGHIDASSAQIEHWEPRSIAPAKSLDYSNMLAVCKGNIYQCSPVNAHCDRSRRNQALKYHPSGNRHIEHTVNYKGGRIFSEEIDWNEQLQNVLNLNCGRLPEAREAALRAFLKILEIKRPTTSWDKAFIERHAEAELKLNVSHLPAYVGIIRHFCQKRLRAK